MNKIPIEKKLNVQGGYPFEPEGWDWGRHVCNVTFFRLTECPPFGLKQPLLLRRSLLALSFCFAEAIQGEKEDYDK